MNETGPIVAWESVSEDLTLFKALSSEQRLTILGAMVRRDLVRGEILVAQGDPSDSLYFVLHGALAVRRTGEALPIAELRAGELVGEIGFFANLPRTANVIAIRDTSVLVLTRAAYQTLAEATPAITEALLGALALRFAKRTEQIPTIRTSPLARTVALIDGGASLFPAFSIDACAMRSPGSTPRSSIRPASVRCFPGGRWMPPK